jgi:hypothetical protein
LVSLLTLLKPVPRVNDTPEMALLDFSGINDTADILFDTAESQGDFTSPYLPFKGKIHQKYFNGKYPRIKQVL